MIGAAAALAAGAATGPLLVLATERFIATALDVAGGGLPFAAIAAPVLMLLAPFAVEVLQTAIRGLTDARIEMRLRSGFRIDLTEKRARLEYRHLESPATADLLRRVAAGPQMESQPTPERGPVKQAFDDVVGLAAVAVRVIGIAVVLAVAVPFVVLGIRGGQRAYELERRVARQRRRATYLSEEVLQGRDPAAERALFGYSDYVKRRWRTVFEAVVRLEMLWNARIWVRFKSAGGVAIAGIIVAMLGFLRPLQTGAIDVAFYVAAVMAQVAGSGPPDHLVGPILVVGAAIVMRELLEMLADPLAVYFGGKGSSVLTAALNEKAARLEIVEFETLEAHERLELAKQGVEAAASMLLFFLFPVYQLTFFAMAASYLFSLSPLLALVIPLMFLPRIASHLIHGSRYYQLERKTVPLLREVQYLERCLVDREYFKETRILGAGAHLLKRYRAAIGRFNVARWREDVRLGVIDLGLNVLVVLGYGGSFLLAALLLAGGSIGVGGFAVVIYAVSRLMLMTRAVMSMLGTSYRASATASHLLEFLRLDEGRPPGASAGVSSAGNLTAREVAFAYPGSERDAVDGVDLEVGQGTTLALVGANGAGKTTLAKLLLGLYVPTAGQVVRGGADTREMVKSEVRANTSAVFQNYQRYQMSLRDNVILADPGAAGDEERLLRALREGGVPEELWQGPDGLDVMLSREFGSRDLSLGQWQRLAIARGLFREHDTILLDEPTAAIDPLEEQAVYERFMQIAAGRTAIIVTHCLASARLADRILVLDAGRIVEDGTHEQLLARRGLYHRMFTAQAAWYRRS